MPSAQSSDRRGSSDFSQQPPRFVWPELIAQSRRTLLLSPFLGVFVFCLSVHLHAQGYPTGEPIVGNSTNVLASSMLYRAPTERL